MPFLNPIMDFGATRIELGTIITNVINALFYGADKAGNTDSSAAIQEAVDSISKGVVYLPAGTYLLRSKLTVPADVMLLGAGDGQTILKKGFNGDMVQLSARSTLRDMGLQGEGATYTGRGIIIADGNDQQVLFCSVKSMESYCLEVTVADVAVRLAVVSGTWYTQTPASIPAVKFPDASETVGGRQLIGIRCAGGLLANFGGCDNVQVDMCNTLGVVFTANSKKVSMIGNRLGTGGATTEVDGIDHTLVGNIIAGPVTLKATSANSAVVGNRTVGAITDSGTGNVVTGNCMVA